MKPTPSMLVALALIGCGGSETASSSPPAPAASAQATPAATVGDAPVSGRLTDAEGAGVEGFLVFASRETGEVPDLADPEQLFCDPDGRFELDLPRDDYDLLALDGQGRQVSVRVDLRQGSVALGELVVRHDPRASEDLFERGPEVASEEAR